MFGQSVNSQTRAMAKAAGTSSASIGHDDSDFATAIDYALQL